MAQHDYVIANASGATVRADINNMALAISSNNSGSSAPSTTYAYLWWLDTGNNLLKLRNSANNAWITMPFSVTASNTVDINGGTIDGTNIGASAAGTGAFTTLSASGDATFSGDVTLASATANKPVLTLTDTNADSQGPDLVFKKDSASPADGDELFRIYGYGDDSGGTQTEYFLMLATMTDVTDGTEDSKVRFMTYGTGSQQDTLTLAGTTAYINNSTPFTAGASVLHLHQPDATSNSYLHITQQDGGATASDGMSIGMLDGGVNAVVRNRENGYLKFWTNNTARMTILSGGQVDIGGSETAHANTDDLIVGSFTGSHGIQINAANTANSSIFFGDNNSSLTGQLEYVHASDYLAIITGANQRLRVDAHGLKFNVNTAETDALDDYEEGSWTIGISSSDPGSMTATASNAYGWYVKVGKVVHVGGSFDLSVSNGQGTMRITGLPYACSSNGTRPLFVGQVGYTVNVVPQPGYITIGNGSSADYIDVWKEGNNSRYNIVDWDSGGRMNFQITYEAN